MHWLGLPQGKLWGIRWACASGYSLGDQPVESATVARRDADQSDGALRDATVQPPGRAAGSMHDLPQRPGREGLAGQALRDARILRHLPPHHGVDSCPVQSPGRAARAVLYVPQRNHGAGQVVVALHHRAVLRCVPSHDCLGSDQLLPPVACVQAATRQDHVRQLPHHQRRNRASPIAREPEAQTDTGPARTVTSEHRRQTRSHGHD